MPSTHQELRHIYFLLLPNGKQQISYSDRNLILRSYCSAESRINLRFSLAWISSIHTDGPIYIHPLLPNKTPSPCKLLRKWKIFILTNLWCLKVIKACSHHYWSLSANIGRIWVWLIKRRLSLWAQGLVEATRYQVGSKLSGLCKNSNITKDLP